MSLFGVMRHSTPEENDAYWRMLDSMGEKLVPEGEVAALKAENAKLQKLLLDVHAIGWSGFDCTECPVSFSGRCESNGGCSWLGILTDLMHELGIEVKW